MSSPLRRLPRRAPPKLRLRAAERRRLLYSKVWRRLTDPAPEEIARGAVLRVPAQHGDCMDFLLAQHDGGAGFALVVAAGEKAGSLKLVLPEDARATRAGVTGVSRSWLISNWERWIYGACGARDVLIAASGYPAPR